MKHWFKRKQRRTPASQRPIHAEVTPWLIAALMLVTLPHLPRLPVWLTLFSFLVIVYRLLIQKYPRLQPGRVLIVTLTMIAIAAITLHYSRLFGRDSGVALLIIMLFLKLLETKTYRDGMVLVALTYFLVVTNFLYSQSIPTAVFMLFVVMFITLCLISLNQGTRTIPIMEKLRISGPLLVFALPLMVLLFVLFPRIPGPIWGLPKDVYGAKTGLSEEMTPGQISQLAFSDEVAFRVKFSGSPPPPNLLYWRAIVFWNYDGRTWRPGQKPKAIPAQLDVSGEAIEYTVTLEPHQQRWLFALDMPVITARSKPPAPYRFVMTESQQLLASKPIITLSQYRLSSYANYRLDTELDPQKRERALQLPAQRNPQTVALAQSWLAETSDPSKLIGKALTMFSQDFTYTLRPPRLGADAIDEFLFESKRGFCEHFASSFVFLLRAAGLPARIVTGYQGGEINPLGNYMLVRQSDAHAWAEVWIEERGWIRVDPTTAVSPARIERGLDAAIPARENPRYLLRRNNRVFAHLNLLLDSFNNRWNEWVLGYGPEMQNLFLSYFGLKNPKAGDLAIWLTLSLIVSLAIIAAISLKRTPLRNRDKVQRLYLKLCRRLAAAGFVREEHEGPSDYLKRITLNNSALGEKIQPIILLYSQIRYGPEGTSTDLHHFERMVRRFKLPKSSL